MEASIRHTITKTVFLEVWGGRGRGGGGGELHYLYYAFILSVRSYIGPFAVSENNV